jgi:hypothetical protein
MTYLTDFHSRIENKEEGCRIKAFTKVTVKEEC